MPVPVNSLKMVGAVAMFITQAGTIDFIKIVPIKGRYFRCKYGVYQLDYSRRISFEGTTLFVYDTRMANPLSPEACKRIQLHLQAENKFVLIRDVVASNHREYIQELGKTSMRFLGDLQKTDMASILNLMNNALQSDKKLPSSEPISQSMVGFFSIFNVTSASNLAFIFVDNAVLKIMPLELVRVEEKLLGKCRYGDLDLTYRRNRYTHQKTSIYITTIDTRPMDLNEFLVEPVDYSKDEQPQEPLAVKVAELPEETVVAEQKVEPEEDLDNLVVLVDSDEPEAPAETGEIAVVKKKQKVPVFKLGFVNGGDGNGRHKKEDIDLPANMKRQDLGTPLTLNMYSMLKQFANYDPSLIEEAYLEGKYAKNAVNAVSPPPKKKQFNIWFAVGIVIIGVIAYQAVGNPLISKWQTDQQKQAIADRAEKSEQNKLKQLEEQRRLAELNGNSTNPNNPQPPANNAGSEVIGGSQIIPNGQYLVPLVRSYYHVH